MIAPPEPDQTERVILRTAEEFDPAQRILVVGDTTGALTAAALANPDAQVWSWTTSRRDSRELFPQDTRLRVLLDDPLTLDEFCAESQIQLVLARLPKSLASLEDLARRVALIGAPDVRLIAGGRVKHMTPSQNTALATAFAQVRGSRGLGKSRALVATSPIAGVTAPEAAAGRVVVRGVDKPLELRGISSTFGGAQADIGSVLLLEALAGVEAETVVDLGCGNGLLTAWAASNYPNVLGSDDNLDAVLSTRATLAANGLEARVTWDDALSQEPDNSADLVLLNPPFHDGTAVDATLVQELLDAAARVLRPGGQLWLVHNSHLRYRAELAARFDAVSERARDRRFTVLSAVAR